MGVKAINFSKQIPMSNFKCILCSDYLLRNPVQCECGDRLCGTCFESLQKRKEDVFLCPTCNVKNRLSDCFRDKAVEYELCNITLKCLNPSCPWEAESRFYQEHKAVCKYMVVPCPNSAYGCPSRLSKVDMRNHMITKCRFRPVQCTWCLKNVLDEQAHIKSECEDVSVPCPNKCGVSVPRKELSKHTRTLCTHQLRNCDYKNLGCSYKGTIPQLTSHAKEYTAYHTQLLKMSHKEVQDSLKTEIALLDNKTAALQSEITKTKSELNGKIQQMVNSIVKAESSIIQLQDGLSEVSLLLQTLQATNYDGTFIWKIPEVTRRRQEAKTGKTVSLYSAPFYTSRHGYKLCLRLYMNGDGTGKGTHLSFFITLMRGEYDALLPWPFRQAVTLTLVDQNKQQDIVQSFRPEPISSSFQRPRNEMNVASGCPTFAPVSVLDKNSYVKDDTLFVKCNINTTELTNE
ncbi:TNF receptor-associated factor 5-like [Halichondria panicea]|uniref:TNF receptor-associated factor 5-like n=1 Tax=Halichondria panicea TaxID=6063 RepID=UPI00312B2FD7